MTTTFEQLLAQDGRLVYKTKGTSMEPMLRQNRDLVIIEVPASRLKKYDVALYRRGESYVLHRVVDVKEDCYLIRGDNTYTLENVPDRAVLGVLTGFVAVDEHLRLLVDAFEMELHKFAGRGLEGLAVLAGAALEPAAASAGGACGGVGGVVDVPVMGKTDALGLSVTGELPAVVEQPGGLGLEADTKTHTD